MNKPCVTQEAYQDMLRQRAAREVAAKRGIDTKRIGYASVRDVVLRGSGSEQPDIVVHHRVTPAKVYQEMYSAYEKLGGLDRIVSWANESGENLTKFYTVILPKLIPSKIEVDNNNNDNLGKFIMHPELQKLLGTIKRDIIPVIESETAQGSTIEVDGHTTITDAEIVNQ